MAGTKLSFLQRFVPAQNLLSRGSLQRCWQSRACNPDILQPAPALSSLCSAEATASAWTFLGSASSFGGVRQLQRLITPFPPTWLKKGSWLGMRRLIRPPASSLSSLTRGAGDLLQAPLR